MRSVYCVSASKLAVSSLRVWFREPLAVQGRMIGRDVYVLRELGAIDRRAERQRQGQIVRRRARVALGRRIRQAQRRVGVDAGDELFGQRVVALGGYERFARE